MTNETTPDSETLASCKISVPQHVVYRSFPSETVVLNLQTGRYHGLNATAGRMLEALQRSSSLREAAKAVASTFDQQEDVVQADMCALCLQLMQRDLIEVERDPAS